MTGIGRRITVHEAQVKTAQVTIKTLTIAGRQVTLAVFRQLQEEPLVDPNSVTLAGIPWGVVNYHPDKCADSGWSHLHVVWQKGEELRRASVYQKRRAVLGVKFEDAINSHYRAWLTHLVLEGHSLDFEVQAYGFTVAHTIAGLRVSLGVDSGDPIWRARDAGSSQHEWYRDKLRKWLDQHKAAGDSVRERNLLEAIIRESQEHQRKWDATYNSLAGLDQLFIAA